MTSKRKPTKLPRKPIHTPFPCISRRKVALVAGASGSGKTMISQMFANAYVHTMDNYFRGPFTELEDGIPNWDDPQAVDFNSWISDYYKILQAIDLGITCSISKHDFVTMKTGSQEFHGEQYKNVKWIVFEGLFSLDARLHHLADLKVFVEAPLATRIARRINRDMKERGVDLKFILSHSYYTQRCYEQYIEPMKKMADLVIPNFDLWR